MQDTIILPFLGGVIIAVAASLMLAFNGKITGISGIISGAVLNFRQDLKHKQFWRYIFLIGMLIGAFLMKFITPERFNFKLSNNIPVIIFAGLLVGFGTRLAGGCTSGHGVCGIPRRSRRSITATIVFMLTGFITVFLKGFL